MSRLIFILMTGVLVNNYVLQQFLGVCPFLGVSKKVKEACGMGVSVSFVMLFATAVTWPIYHYVLYPKYTYLQTIVFILVIASLVQFLEMFLKRFVPSLFKALGVYLPLITTNCAVLGITIENIKKEYTFVESVFSALGVGLGFLLAMVLFAGVRSKLIEKDPPKAFRGLPVTLLAASIVAMAFYGFSGVVEALLG